MNRLTVRILAFLVAAVGLMPCSYAAEPVAQNDFHFALALGLTEGGDSLAKAEYNNGDSVTIHGGGLFQAGAGVWYHKPSVPLSAMLSINYQYDQANARNGTIKFDRWPLELLGYYHFNDSWRVGAGIRHVMNPELRIDVRHQPYTRVDYRDANSPVFEVAWGPHWGWNRDHFWVSLRYVHESLHEERLHIEDQPSIDVNQTDDGSHVGLFVYYAF